MYVNKSCEGRAGWLTPESVSFSSCARGWGWGKVLGSFLSYHWADSKATMIETTTLGGLGYEYEYLSTLPSLMANVCCITQLYYLYSYIWGHFGPKPRCHYGWLKPSKPRWRYRRWDSRCERYSHGVFENIAIVLRVRFTRYNRPLRGVYEWCIRVMVDSKVHYRDDDDKWKHLYMLYNSSIKDVNYILVFIIPA